MKTNSSFENKLFRLSTGEEVQPELVGKLIEDTCHYVRYARVKQNEKNETVAFIFPKKSFYSHPDYTLTANDGCFCPRTLDELGKCLTGCLKQVNQKLEGGENRIQESLIINQEAIPINGAGLSYEEIIEAYREQLLKTKGTEIAEEDEVYYIKNS